jgi:hypothetical protein
VFYGTDYETELQSYYEADDELELLSGEHLDRIEPAVGLLQIGPVLKSHTTFIH